MVAVSVTFRQSRSNVFSAQPSEGEVAHQTVGATLAAYNCAGTDNHIVRIPSHNCPVRVLQPVLGEFAFRCPGYCVVEVDLDHTGSPGRLLPLAIEQRRVQLGPTLSRRTFLGILPPQIHPRSRICDHRRKEDPLHDKHRSLMALYRDSDGTKYLWPSCTPFPSGIGLPHLDRRRRLFRAW